MMNYVAPMTFGLLIGKLMLEEHNTLHSNNSTDCYFYIPSVCYNSGVKIS